MRLLLFSLLLQRVIRWGFAAVFWLAAMVLPAHVTGDAAARGGSHHSAEYCVPRAPGWARTHRAVARSDRGIQTDDRISARQARSPIM